MNNPDKELHGKFYDFLKHFEKFLTRACMRYQVTAPTVDQHCDELYVRLGREPEKVSLAEISAVLQLREGGVWDQPNYAANRIYKLRQRLGMSVEGQAGF